MKIHIKFSILFFILFFLSLIISGQSYRNGYIISNKNDTIRGLLKYKGGKNAAQICKFEIPESGITKHFKPGEITGYRFDEGKYYISKEIPVEGDSIMLFAEFLIKGIANIYFVNYKSTNHYYIETDNAGLIELTEPDRILETDSGTFILPTKYKGKLTYSLSDYPAIQEEVRHLDISHKSLIKLARNYHEAVCDSVQCIIFEKKVKKLWVGFGLNAGYTTSRYNFGNKVDSHQGSGYSIGAFLTLNNIVVSNERFFLQFDLIFNNHKKNIFIEGKNGSSEEVTYNGSVYRITDGDTGTTNGYASYVNTLDAEIKVVSLKIPITINYSGIGKVVRPYFGFGLNTQFVISQNEDFIVQKFYETYGRSVPGFLYGFKARAGLKVMVGDKNAVFAEANYDYLVAYNINSFLRLKINSFAFMVGFRF